MTANIPLTDGGPPTNYIINPPLPPGLAMDGNTGVISGTPTTLMTKVRYQVTGSNTGGLTQCEVNITIVDGKQTLLSDSYLIHSLAYSLVSLLYLAVPFNLAYAAYPTGNPSVPANRAALPITTAISPPWQPTAQGGAVLVWGINPALPVGLVFSSLTGAISGTPSVLQPITQYVVSATNTGGTASLTIEITVVDGKYSAERLTESQFSSPPCLCVFLFVCFLLT